MGSRTTAMEPPADSTEDPSNTVSQDVLSQALESLRSMPKSSSLLHDAANLLSSFQPQDWAALIQSTKPSPPPAPKASVPATAMSTMSKAQKQLRKIAMAGRPSRHYNTAGRPRRYSESGASSSTKQSLPTPKRQRMNIEQLEKDLGLESVLNDSAWRRKSIDDHSSQCCSSCSEGIPCVESDCEFQKEEVVPCIEPECKQPLCLDECLSEAFEGEPALYQGHIPSSARLSDWDYSVWNPQLQRSPPQMPSNMFKGLNSMGHIGHNHQLTPAPRSGLPTPPSMINNMDTPFSPTSLATPQSTNGSQTDQPNVSGSILSGTGMMFDAVGAQWNQQNFDNSSMGNDSLMFNCAWTGCAQPFANQQEWTEHIHHAHVDPQMTFYCPMPTETCPPNISHHPIHHLEADHGFNFLIDNQYSCPAPDCSSDQTFLNPKMLHNHFDQAHSFPASGSLFCKWNSCDTSFTNPHELFSHLNEHHQLSNLLTTDVHGEPLDAETKYPSVIPDAELSEDDTRNRCMWKTGHGGICGKVCDTESDLQTHVKEAHLKSLNNRVGYNCQWQGCSRPAKLGNKSGFTARGKLERHMASHTGCRLFLASFK